MTRTRSATAAASIAVLAFALAACGDNGPTAEGEFADGELAALLANESRDAHHRGERRAGSSLFERLAAEIPGFGGLYRTAPCALAVVLTDMSQADHAVSIVKAAIEPRVKRACPEGVTVDAVEGQYTYAELVRYHHAAQPLLQLDGVLGIAPNYQLNRLVIVVASRRVANAVLDALPRVGVPEAVVVFRLRGDRH